MQYNGRNGNVRPEIHPAARPCRNRVCCGSSSTTCRLLIQSQPEDTVLEARLEAHLDRSADSVRVRVQSIQTWDSFHIEASMELAGKPFARRSWDLDLGSG